MPVTVNLDRYPSGEVLDLRGELTTAFLKNCFSKTIEFGTALYILIQSTDKWSFPSVIEKDSFHSRWGQLLKSTTVKNQKIRDCGVPSLS